MPIWNLTPSKPKYGILQYWNIEYSISLEKFIFRICFYSWFETIIIFYYYFKRYLQSFLIKIILIFYSIWRKYNVRFQSPIKCDVSILSKTLIWQISYQNFFLAFFRCCVIFDYSLRLKRDSQLYVYLLIWLLSELITILGMIYHFIIQDHNWYNWYNFQNEWSFIWTSKMIWNLFFFSKVHNIKEPEVIVSFFRTIRQIKFLIIRSTF